MYEALLLPILIFLIMFLLFIALLGKASSRIEAQQKIKERLSSVSYKSKSETTTYNLFQKQRTNLIEKKLQQYLRSFSSESWLKLKLYQGGIHLSYTELLLMVLVAITMSTMLLGLLTGMNLPYRLLIGFGFTIVCSFFIMNLLIRIRKKKMLHQLPMAFDIILRAIKAGHSLEKVLTIIAKEVPAPFGSEINRMCQQLDLGVSFEQALHSAADRIALRDFDFFTIALIIQRQSGGSLGDVLENIIFILMRRQEIRSKMTVLTAEARTTAVILGAIPIILGIGITIVSQDYVDFFLRNPSGQKLFTLAICLMVIEFIIMRWLMRFKVY